MSALVVDPDDRLVVFRLDLTGEDVDGDRRPAPTASELLAEPVHEVRCWERP